MGAGVAGRALKAAASACACSCPAAARQLPQTNHLKEDESAAPCAEQSFPVLASWHPPSPTPPTCAGCSTKGAGARGCCSCQGGGEGERGEPGRRQAPTVSRQPDRLFPMSHPTDPESCGEGRKGCWVCKRQGPAEVQAGLQGGGWCRWWEAPLAHLNLCKAPKCLHSQARLTSPNPTASSSEEL